MKRILPIIGAFLFLTIGTFAQAMQGSASVGSLTANPAAGAVILSPVTLNATTTNGTNWAFEVILTNIASAATQFDIQTLNTSSVAVAHVYIMVPANSSFTYSTGQMSFQVPAGYKLQVVSTNAVTGSVQAAFYYASDGGY